MIGEITVSLNAGAYPVCWLVSGLVPGKRLFPACCGSQQGIAVPGRRRKADGDVVTLLCPVCQGMLERCRLQAQKGGNGDLFPAA